jgi:hypothetical protein
MVSSDINNISPSATYHVSLRPKNGVGYDLSSFHYTFTTPGTYGGSVLTGNNALLQTNITGSGAIISGTGNPSNQINTMYIDGSGLKAFDNFGASTVYISSIDGNAYFKGTVVAGSGSIGGWSISPNKLSSGLIALDSTAGNQKIYIGSGSYNNTNTAFYVDQSGRFSLFNQLYYNPSSGLAGVDDFGELTVVGKIRGSIQNIDQIPSNKLSGTISSVNIVSTTSAVVTTTASTAFLAGEYVSILGLTGNASVVNGRKQINEMSSNNTQFGVTIVGGVVGTYSQSATVNLQELTMGLHPAAGTGTYAASAGIGIRLDPYNWWYTNNQFRVGDSSNYMLWKDNVLALSGSIVSSAGQIGGWAIGLNSLSVGSNTNFIKFSNNTNNVLIAGGELINYINNPDFEYNLEGWVKNGSTTTIARVTTDFYSGSACLEVTKAAVANSGAAYSAKVPVVAGLTYSYSAWVKIPAGQESGTFQGYLQWFDRLGNFLSASTVGTISLTNVSGWQRIVGTATAPSGAVSCIPFVLQGTAGTAGQKYLIDAVLFEEGSTPSTYTQNTAPIYINKYGASTFTGKIQTANSGKRIALESYDYLSSAIKFYTAASAEITPAQINVNYRTASAYNTQALVKFSGIQTSAWAAPYIQFSTGSDTDGSYSEAYIYGALGSVIEGAGSKIEIGDQAVATMFDIKFTGANNANGFQFVGSDVNILKALYVSNGVSFKTANGNTTNAAYADLTSTAFYLSQPGIAGTFDVPALILDTRTGDSISANWYAQRFRRNGANHGGISVTTSTTTLPFFFAGSDYRLKENVETIDNSWMSNKIKNLRPVTYNEINSTNKIIGFIAHEVQEYIPESVVGEKDAVDEDGNIIPQNLGTAPFIPYLVGALKDALLRIEALEEEIALLRVK